MKSQHSVLFLLIFITLLCCNCKEEEFSRNYPIVELTNISNISTNGAVFNAEFTYRGNFKILQYGFTWATNENPNLQFSDKVVYSGNITSANFSSEITTTLEKDTIYFVKPFVVTEDYTVYGKEVSFFSLGSSSPQIDSFSPTSGSCGDTVRIFGRNFSYIYFRNTVYFGDYWADVVEASDTVLTVITPPGYTNYGVAIEVAISGKSSVSTNNFTYLPADEFCTGYRK